MAAQKKAVQMVARNATAYVYADEDGGGVSDPFPTPDEATDEAKEWLTDAYSEETTSQVVFALVPMYRIAKGGITVTPITE